MNDTWLDKLLNSGTEIFTGISQQKLATAQEKLAAAQAQANAQAKPATGGATTWLIVGGVVAVVLVAVFLFTGRRS